MAAQDKFNNVLVTSLNRILTVSIVKTLYKRDDILNILKQNEEMDEPKQMRKTEQLLYQKMQLLPLPKALIQNSFNVCKLIALEGNVMLGFSTMLRPNETSCRCGFKYSIPLDYFDYLSFKPDGTVDYLKTFSLLNETNYPSWKIFIAASHLCSRDLVFRSWETLLPDFDTNLSGLEIYNRLLEKHKFSNCVLNKYWIYLINNRLPDLTNDDVLDPDFGFYNEGFFNVYDYILKFALGQLNVQAFIYFFQIVTEEEKLSLIEKISDGVLITITFYSNYSEFHNRSIKIIDILFYLLSQINEKQVKIQILKRHISQLIIPLLSNIIYQQFLHQVIDLVWDALDENEFESVCENILELKVKGEHIVTRKLFTKLWFKSPDHLKKSFVDYFCGRNRSIECDNDNFNNYFHLLKLVLAECTEELKHDYLHSSAVTKKLLTFIPKNIDYLIDIDHLIKENLESDLEIATFKKFVVENNTYCYQFALYHFIRHDDYESADKLLEWSLPTRTEIDDYKQNFNFMMGFLGSSRFCINDDYEVADNFVNWSFNSDEESVKEFKGQLAVKSCTWFHFNEWELFLKYVDWCFGKNKEEMKAFKEFMSTLEKLENAMRRIENNEFDYLNNYLDWCLCPAKVMEFKIKHFTFPNLILTLNRIALKMIQCENREIPFASCCVMAENLAVWFGPIGLSRIKNLKKIVENVKKGPETRSNTIGIYNERVKSMVMSLLDDFIVSLESQYISDELE